MNAPDEQALARLFGEISSLLEIQGESVFKTQAYTTGAAALLSHPEPVRKLVAEGRLADLPGFGKALTAKVEAWCATGRMELHERLTAELPLSLLELRTLQGLGPKKVLRLFQELGVRDLNGLKAALDAGRVAEMAGFGPKSAKQLLEALAQRQKGGRIPLALARPIGLFWEQFIRSQPGVLRANLAGSARRFAETVGDLDVIAGLSDAGAAQAVAEALCSHPEVKVVLARGESKVSVVLQQDIQLDLRMVPDSTFAAALHHFTGSKGHHLRLRALARERGLTVSEWGVFRLQADGSAGEALPIPDEASLYAAVGIAPLPPELREEVAEWEEAVAGRTPALIERSDVRGVTHAHTTFSDGRNTVLEMAEAARAHGLSWLTITDHSQAASYAGGLKPERFAEQWAAIDAAQALVPEVRLLRGAEVDILEDGSLDYPDELLAQLDVVIASIHTRFKLDAQQMTARIARALSHPLVHIWGHATGRLVGEREPYPCDMEALLTLCAERGVVVELNGTPERLDLSDAHARLARKLGVTMVLSTDAHATDQLENVDYALAVARRAGLRRSDLLNHLDAEGFRTELVRRRQAREPRHA